MIFILWIFTRSRTPCFLYLFPLSLPRVRGKKKHFYLFILVKSQRVDALSHPTARVAVGAVLVRGTSLLARGGAAEPQLLQNNQRGSCGGHQEEKTRGFHSFFFNPAATTPVDLPLPTSLSSSSSPGDPPPHVGPLIAVFTCVCVCVRVRVGTHSCC